MKDNIRAYAIVITNFFACAGFTVITPFYPAVADRVGIPDYIIGVIFSTFPIASIIVSLFLPKLMFSIGRSTILISGLALIGISSILISFLEDFSPTIALLVSFLSRFLTGSGAACASVASISILSSDYTENFQILVAMVEVFGGLGIIAGPLVGSLLFSIGGFSLSCKIIGVFVILYIPLLLTLLGKSKPYVIDKKEKISIRSMIVRPVIII
jgi:MFS family permease